MELEEIMEKLDETVRKMEQEKLTLEQSYQVFSEGMELVKQGNQTIDKVEKKIQILMREGESFEGKNRRCGTGFCRLYAKRRGVCENRFRGDEL